jgi:septation ring formation regulator EzrA
MDNHAEIKDKCDDLETRLDEIASDIRDLPFDYKLVDIYSNIDEEIHNIYEWYESMKELIKAYTKEKVVIDGRLRDLETRTKSLNHSVQNLKLQEFSRAQDGDLYSRPHGNQRL